MLPIRQFTAVGNEQGHLLRVFTGCFGCWYMEANDEISVEAGFHTYGELRKLLNTLGHPSEEAEA
ncbi:MAG: hypothetical protein EOO63_13330 [Hymenobacter sp.]|nr:MAG: hypothetical protein EOO63_13330 [Hymenobacter sp.]